MPIHGVTKAVWTPEPLAAGVLPQTAVFFIPYTDEVSHCRAFIAADSTSVGDVFRSLLHMVTT